MGYKLTGDMGYTSNWADALEKCVIDGSKTAICEFAGERSLSPAKDHRVPGTAISRVNTESEAVIKRVFRSGPPKVMLAVQGSVWKTKMKNQRQGM